MASLADMLDDGPAADDGGGDDDYGPDTEQAGKDAMKAFMSAVSSKDFDAAWEHFKTLQGLCPDEVAEEKDKGGGPESGEHHALLLMPHKG